MFRLNLYRWGISLIDINDKGSPIRTLEVTDPNVTGKKIVVWAVPFSSVLIIAYLSYYAFVVFKDDPFFPPLFMATMVFIVGSDMFIFLWYRSLFGRNWQKIVFYQKGVEFPHYLWDRMHGRGAFLPRVEIASVKAVFPSGARAAGMNTASLTFITNSGKIYRTGDRIKADIISISEWMETNWKIIVECKDLRGNSVSAAHKVPVISGARTRTCVGCGYSFSDNTDFCPSCGKMISNGEGSIEPPATAGALERTQSSGQPHPAQSYQDQPPQNQYAAPYKGQYDQDSPPDQRVPTYQNQYAGPEHSAPPQSHVGYGQFQNQPPVDPYAKNPRLAMILAAVLGLLGMMGIGHIYMRKYAKGIVLLLIGAFFAFLSLVSIIMIFSPSDFSLETRVITAAIFSAPFMILYLWQVFNAPKPNRSKAAQDPYGYYKPPYGP